MPPASMRRSAAGAWKCSRPPTRCAAASGFFIVTACTDHPVMCRVPGLVSSRLASLSGPTGAGFLAPAAMSGLGNGPHIGLVTSGGYVLQSPDEGRPSRHGDRAAPVLILPLATAVVAAGAFAGELRW